MLADGEDERSSESSGCSGRADEAVGEVERKEEEEAERRGRRWFMLWSLSVENGADVNWRDNACSRCAIIQRL